MDELFSFSSDCTISLVKNPTDKSFHLSVVSGKITEPVLFPLDSAPVQIKAAMTREVETQKKRLEQMQQLLSRPLPPVQAD